MTIQFINTGSSANSGDGDTLRVAFTKINKNFEGLISILGSSSTDFVEISQDVISSMIVHDRHVGLSSHYDDLENVVEFTVNPEVFQTDEQVLEIDGGTSITKYPVPKLTNTKSLDAGGSIAVYSATRGLNIDGGASATSFDTLIVDGGNA